jgi:hypothetical protein
VFSEIISFVLPGAHWILNWPWRTRSRTHQNAYPSLWFVWLDGVVGNAFGGVLSHSMTVVAWPSHFG